MSNLNLRYKTRYGLDFGVDVHDIFIELLCAKRWREPEFSGGSLDSPDVHMLRAIRALFTRSEWTISPWTEEHAYLWCTQINGGIIGSAASSKSFDTGGLCLLDWLTSPWDTISLMVSTSKVALADRTFASVLELYQVLKKSDKFYIPGKISKTSMAILLDESDGVGVSDKTAIRGLAVQQGGTVEDCRASLVGRHENYCRLIADELEAMKDSIAGAVVDARSNLSIGAGRDFKFVFLANPESRVSVCGRLAEPKHGWDTVDENTTRWETTTGGLVLRRNGYLSPAVVEEGGPEKYPYLIRKSQIDQIILDNHGNMNAPAVWTMVIGFPPPVGSLNTVLSEGDIATFKMRESPVFHSHTEGVRWVAGLDPAFTTGGDACVLQRARVGYFREGGFGIAFEPPDYISLDASSKRPITYQISDAVRRLCSYHGIPIGSLAVDSSGSQSVADVVHAESGVRPIYCNFGSKSENERAKNKVTEIWLLVSELGRHHQVRGMNDKAVSQFCSRLFSKALVPLELEGKAAYKKRTGSSSPDEADALALACLAARQVCGLVPGVDRPDIDLRGRFVDPRAMSVSSGYEYSLDMGGMSGYACDNSVGLGTGYL